MHIHTLRTITTTEQAQLIELGHTLASTELLELFMQEPAVFEDEAENRRHFSFMRMGLEVAIWSLASRAGIEVNPHSFQISYRLGDVAEIKAEIVERFAHGVQACRRPVEVTGWKLDALLHAASAVSNLITEFKRSMAEATARAEERAA